MHPKKKEILNGENIEDNRFDSCGENVREWEMRFIAVSITLAQMGFVGGGKWVEGGLRMLFEGETESYRDILGERERVVFSPFFSTNWYGSNNRGP